MNQLSKLFAFSRNIYNNHVGKSLQLARFSSSSFLTPKDKLKSKYDAVIIGGGHNGLISAAYLAKSGLSVAVLERRHLIGGAAVTEEIIPGFKFSRASYVLSLLRPIIIKDLELKKHGLKWHVRTTGAFTPIRDSNNYLMLSLDPNITRSEIEKFSKKDAQNFPLYGEEISKCLGGLRHFLDHPMLHPDSTTRELIQAAQLFAKAGYSLGREFPKWYEFLTAPISKVLDRWFESDVLKATLATDGVIGAMISPYDSGSGYVLLHHEIGELDGVAGCWGFAEGGMGAVSEAIAKSARQHGADIFVNAEVDEIVVSDATSVSGVKLLDGSFVETDCVLSNATIHKTSNEMLRNCDAYQSSEYARQVASYDYTSPVTKINVAVDRIPNFKALPNKSRDEVAEQHKGTIHINCENVQMLHEAYVDAKHHQIASKVPMIELCIPSSADQTISPKGSHVISLFTQYTPYYLKGREWTDEDRKAYADTVFSHIDDYVDGFTSSIVGYDLLTPPDLENVFGLTGGNIFHGAMSFDQLLFSRPTSMRSSYETSVKGLYLCGSGTHPGGGVMGASGRLSALTVIKHKKENKI